MNLLVSGGAGYVGSIVAEQLLRKGYKVIILDNLQQGHREAVLPGAELVIADICDAFGRTVETITAPKKGVLWTTNMYPMTPSGSRIGTLGIDVSYI